MSQVIIAKEFGENQSVKYEIFCLAKNNWQIECRTNA